MESNEILGKSSFVINAHFDLETSVPVICYVIADAWLKAMPDMP